MSTFVDASAFFAVMDQSDRCHSSAISMWQSLLDHEKPLVTSSYVLIETISLMHNRFGTGLVRRFLNDIVPVVEIVWADVPDHVAAVSAMLVHTGKSGPSLVDCMSFHVIRQRQICDVFAYDKHFEGHGFNLIG